MSSTLQRTTMALVAIMASLSCYGQDLKGVYIAMEESFGQVVTHELKFSETYSTHTVYQVEPAFFIRTLGGFYKQTQDSILVELEFNSDYEKDSVTTRKFGYEIEGDQLIINKNKDRIYTKMVPQEQELDGTWLFGTRGPDLGQERRGDSRSRKTLKFLIDGRFQWIAYDIESFRFMGSGGGNYTSSNGKYIEQVDYFSRDNKRAGAQLSFIYTLAEDDWHHIGNNSRGDPMYEIWMKRRR